MAINIMVQGNINFQDSSDPILAVGPTSYDEEATVIGSSDTTIRDKRFNGWKRGFNGTYGLKK